MATAFVYLTAQSITARNHFEYGCPGAYKAGDKWFVTASNRPSENVCEVTPLILNGQSEFRTLAEIKAAANAVGLKLYRTYYSDGKFSGTYFFSRTQLGLEMAEEQRQQIIAQEAEPAITAIHLYDANEAQNRSISVLLSTGATVTIEPLYEAWQQFGGTTDELWITKKIADKYNGWLHGKNRPADGRRWETIYFKPANLIG